jgi:hypothetical protein
MRGKLVALVTCFTLGFGCGSQHEQPAASPTPLGPPITGLATNAWTWVPFPDSACSDGSPTGIGVNPGSDDLVIFMDGGGACANALTCFGVPALNIPPTATLGPFGEAQFQGRLAQLPGSIFDRSLPGNPFADATLVFFPYCTGDVHGGNKVVPYTSDPGGTVHHVGHLNVLAYLKRIAATYPSPRRIVVSGSSAGGFGALVNYEAIRAYYPAAQGFLIDDSGPPLESNGGPLIQAGFHVWGITDVLDPLCGGPGICENNLSRGLAALLARHPADRMSLLSWSDDPTISRFYVITTFPADLLKLTTDVIDPSPNGRAFIVSGSSHTVLGSPGTVSQNGVSLLSWLGEQVGGSAGWATVRPP